MPGAVCETGAACEAAETGETGAADTSPAAVGSAGDSAGAHDPFAAPLKEQQPLEEFRRAIEKTPSLFAITDTTFTDRSIDGSGAKLSGTVTLQAGTKVPASFELVQEGDTWKLIAYHLGSGR